MAMTPWNGDNDDDGGGSIHGNACVECVVGQGLDMGRGGDDRQRQRMDTEETTDVDNEWIRKRQKTTAMGQHQPPDQETLTSQVYTHNAHTHTHTMRRNQATKSNEGRRREKSTKQKTKRESEKARENATGTANMATLPSSYVFPSTTYKTIYGTCPKC